MYRKWSEEEKQAVYALLREHSVTEAARIHAQNTGRTVQSILSNYSDWRRRHLIPQEVLDNIPKSVLLWTKDETKLLLDLIEKHPHNFSEAFRQCAEITGRSVSAVELYFGEYRRKNEAKTCMLTLGRKKRASPNRKNIYAGTGGSVETVRVSKWKRILRILWE